MIETMLLALTGFFVSAGLLSAKDRWMFFVAASAAVFAATAALLERRGNGRKND